VLLVERELDNLDNRRLRRKAEAALRETDRRNQLLLDNSLAAIGYIHEGMHIYANRTYAQLFGYEDVDDLAGIPIIDLIAEEDQGKFKSFLRSLESNEYDGESEEFTCVASDGARIISNMTMSQAAYDGEPCTQVIFRPMTEDTREEERAQQISRHDLLTGLYNRESFLERLETVFDQASDGKQAWVLFYIALDDFARIRAEAGVSNADLVLGDLATLIREQVGEHILARFGDEVFTLLYKGGDKEQALKLGERIRAAVEGHTFDASGKSYKLTVSIGLSLITENAPSTDEVISRGERAAVSIKGGNGVKFHQAEKAKAAKAGPSSANDRIKNLFRSALAKNELKLRYQPIISLHGDDEEQFEVLCRLLDEKGNEIIPADFLGPADEAGLLEKLDRWVILQSIKVLSKHRSAGHKTRFFINITHKSISDESFLPWVSVALKAARLPSDAIIFQIHENDATTYMKQAAKFARGMAQLHCKTSLNHFGCSLDPFNLLKHVTPDYVKLDGSFAGQIENSAEKQKELIDMVKSLQSKGVLTAISGVESPIVVATLWQSGINFIQGNYISLPLENLDYDFSNEDM
jgi:diguanylate cyclase (GGDEF)-like protein/PAS domain S-box-containing protein